MTRKEGSTSPHLCYFALPEQSSHGSGDESSQHLGLGRRESPGLDAV